MKAPYTKTLIMAVLALTISSVAMAQKTSDIINSGEDFLAVCQYDNNRPPDVCLAYVAGVAGTLALNWSDTGQRICLPDNATLRTTLDLVLQYIKDNQVKGSSECRVIGETNATLRTTLDLVLQYIKDNQ